MSQSYRDHVIGPIELVAEDLQLFAQLLQMLVDALQAPVDHLARLVCAALREPVVAEQH